MAKMPADNPVQAILFDLDGTLVDTAPDLAAALNFVVEEENFAPLPYALIRPVVSRGADGLLQLAFGDALETEKKSQLKAQLIAFYKQHIAVKSALFEGMDEVLTHLEQRKLPWGIVTNKPQHLTEPLLEALNLHTRASCVVSGDQVTHAKPHPESIHLACQQLGVSPLKSLYVGDAERDIRAGQLAGCQTVACEYGYIPADEDINSWQAGLIVSSPVKLNHYLNQIL